MPTTIRHKRSSTVGAVPLPGSLTSGELAINSSEGRLFTKLDNGLVMEFGGPPGNAVPAETFGAKPDNTGINDGTDNASAIQAALNYVAGRGGGTVTLGPGRFRTGALTIPSGVRLRGAGRGVTTLNPGTTSAASWISFTGAFGAEVNTLNIYGRGDTAIATASAHGLAVNDIILIKSQRDANSDDAGSLWQLGGDNQAVFFAEFLAVQSVGGATAFVSASPLIFPSYRNNNSVETSPNARARTTISKLTPCRDAEISDMTLLNGPNISAIIRGTGAVNCFARRINFEMGTLPGYACIWRSSLGCAGEDCVSAHDASTDYSVSFFSYNDFLVSGGQNCGFRKCGGVLGSQSFDITFETNGIPHVNCFLDGCWTLWNKWTPATTHPGGYGAQITNCRFLQCARSGVSIRSRASIVTGNLVTAAVAAVADSYGISLREGWARECVVAHNYIDGFEKGITLHDSGAGGVDGFSNRNFEKFEDIIEANTIKNVAYGIWRQKSASNTATTNTGLVLRGNHIQASNSGIDIDGAHGISVKGNTVRGALSGRGIRLQNANDCAVFDNEFDDLGSGIIPIHITSTCARWAYGGNIVRGAAGNISVFSTDSALVWENNIGRASINIADDSVVSFPIPSNHALVTVSGYRSAMNGAGALRATSEKLYGNANFAVANGVLTGTTGTDGNVTISINSGVVYIENRSGGADTMSVEIMASAA